LKEGKLMREVKDFLRLSIVPVFMGMCAMRVRMCVCAQF